jgi:hypothetical protein
VQVRLTFSSIRIDSGYCSGSHRVRVDLNGETLFRGQWDLSTSDLPINRSDQVSLPGQRPSSLSVDLEYTTPGVTGICRPNGSGRRDDLDLDRLQQGPTLSFDNRIPGRAQFHAELLTRKPELPPWRP